MAMKTIIVDDEPLVLREISDECACDETFEVIGTFSDSVKALEFSREHFIDFAILDIQMPQLNGLELAKKLRESNPDMIIIFVTAYSEYALDALKLKADYVVMKPYSLEDITDALGRAAVLSNRVKKRVFIRTFGRFDVLINDQPIHFSSKKSKELLALLIDKCGSPLTTTEIISYLWSDREVDKATMSNFRQTLARLRMTLSENRIDNLLICNQNGKQVNVNAYDCDYYIYKKNKHSPDAAFTGEYMSQYNWAKDTLASLFILNERED